MGSPVITGIGIVSALGADRETVWKKIKSGQPVMGRVGGFRPEEFGLENCVVAQIGDAVLENVRDRCERRFQNAKRAGRYAHLAMAAAMEAIEHSGMAPGSIPDNRASVIIGTSFAGAEEFERSVVRTHAGRRPLIADNFGMRTSMVLQNISFAFGIGGASHGLDAACSSGAAAVLQAARMIRSGEADWCLAGGIESSLSPTRLKMTDMLGVISKRFGEDPSRASRPFDRHRDGFVPGDASVFLVIESEERAAARSAAIMARIAGYSERIFTQHPTRLSSRFAAAMMVDCINSAGLRPSDIGWINAHAAGTPQGDPVEANAIAEVLSGAVVPVSAPKSVSGHLMAASGAFELAVSALSIRDNVIPGTINLDSLDVDCPIESPRQTISTLFNSVLCNSFGFGGQGSSVLITR